ncbi:TrkH family potassium uptake protein [Phormidium sp. FACHB-1136]|uniref:TrkH family potassium uptake protein n=1 Tax=Phormidium sp. FACHB-1136 TaxID=2692848 RepID=UPI0016869D0C|nr:TrkH family potassium uptake protein [Phormidium sp. FACHB-1136]MBD2426391.1 ATPase [Phormidium sp. FACHB-1136]
MTVSRTVCLGFLVFITIGTVLLLLPWANASGQWGNPLVALFTATSAVCVTGLIVVDTGTYFSPLGQGIILALIQIGGLGYMTANSFLMLLLGRRLKLKDRVAIQQSMDHNELAGGSSLIVSIIAMTMIIELTGMFVLYPTFQRDFGVGLGLWLSIFHSISAFNNAGFSLFADSVVGYALNPWVNFAITGLVILGGIGYQVIMELFLWARQQVQGDRRRTNFSLNFKVAISTTLALLVVGTVAFFIIEFNNAATLGNYAPHHKLLMAWFQSVIARTAGFNSIDIGAMGEASLFIMIALMFVGASPGSTGGGIKTTTLRILLACTRMVLQGKEDVLSYRRQIPPSRVLKAIAVVMGSGLLVLSATTLVSISNPTISFIDVLFESVSAFATVGLSTGITADLSDVGKYVIIITMYLGRLGILLFMAALLGDPKPTAIQYPEEDLLIG